MSKQTDLINVTDAITVDGSNNVGIGIASPAAKLDVSASSGTLFRAEYAGIAQLNIGNGGTSTNYYDGDTQIFRSGTGTERMRIDAAGRVTMPYQPAFLAHGNNAGYIPVSTVGSGSYIPFANAVTNIGNHYNSSTYKFTAPVAGMYHFYSAVYTRTGTATEDIYTRWVVNNSSNKGYAYFFNVTGSEIHNTLTDSIDIYLNANDYIGVTINGAGGADMYTGFQECRFSGYLIG